MSFVNTCMYHPLVVEKGEEPLLIRQFRKISHTIFITTTLSQRISGI